MATATQLRKPLGVRVTAQEHRVLVAAAKREKRSLSNFVLCAALEAARRETDVSPQERTPAAIEAAIREAQQLMRPYRPKGRRASDELIAERHAEAMREG